MIQLAQFDRAEVERFDGIVEHLKKASHSLEGRGGVSQFERLELQPGYDQLQHHLDRALAWAEEMKLIIHEELSPPVMRR